MQVHVFQRAACWNFLRSLFNMHVRTHSRSSLSLFSILFAYLPSKHVKMKTHGMKMVTTRKCSHSWVTCTFDLVLARVTVHRCMLIEPLLIPTRFGEHQHISVCSTYNMRPARYHHVTQTFPLFFFRVYSLFDTARTHFWMKSRRMMME